MNQLPIQSSFGLVHTQFMHHPAPFELASGKWLNEFTLAYETYGKLNQNKNNAILICHALTGSANAAGSHNESTKPGWWDNFIGPGKVIDTNHFFVVSSNNLGGCNGSTGPLSTNPNTGQSYGAHFPTVRVRDWVNSQHLLMQYLGIKQWAAIIGGSLGGMQVMRWSLQFPTCVRHSIILASSMKLTSQNIAFNVTAREAIIQDEQFATGHFYQNEQKPHKGVSLARMIGHLTYLSDDGMDEKFGRDLKSGSFALGQDSELEFQIASYLRYQGNKFAKAFDANSYILMTQALDYFDLAREYDDDPVSAFNHALCDFLVISFTSDWRFSAEKSRDIVNALIAAKKKVVYANIESNAGHDAFLLPNPQYEAVFRGYMQRVIKSTQLESHLCV